MTGCPGPTGTDAGGYDAYANWPDRGIPGEEDAPEIDAFVPEGVDANLPDAHADDAGSPIDAFFAGDAGMPPADGSVPGAPSEVTRMGSGALLLRGTVLAPSGPITPGEVLVVGNTIQCVAASCAAHPMAGAATVIETHGTISPGLIDGHNHATYDFLPEWVAPDLFDSRYEWRGDSAYSAHIGPESDGGTRGEMVCPATKWAELRSIVHGTTTIQGQSPRQSCVDRLARNADHYHGLPSRTNTSFGTSIAGPCEGTWTGCGDMRCDPSTGESLASCPSDCTVASGCGDGTCSSGAGETRTSCPRDCFSIATASNDAWRAARIADWVAGDTTRLAIHLGEGVRGMGTTRTNVLREYDCYRGQATGGTGGDHTIDLLEDASGTPYGTAYFIHATAMTAAQIDEAHAAGAYFVWSPSSNLILYGATTDIGHLVEIGAVVGIGPDWTVSGEDDVLAEMRFGYEYGRGAGIASLTPERLFLMATRDGARAVDLDADIGTIEVGKRADLVVFGRISADPYRAVLDSRAPDVRLVLIDGLAYYGDVALETATAVNGMCEDFDACGAAKFLCVAGTPGATARADETYESIRTQLRTILETGYAGMPDTAYGRGDELAELVTCPP